MGITGQPLAGKAALITGGSRGIGAGITRKLAAWGCDVCINFVDHVQQANELRAELTAAGARAHLLRADLAEPEQIASLFAAYREHYDHLDILVHNAGAAVFRALSDATLAHWDYVQNVNARSTLLLAQHARPLMAGRRARFITLTNSTTTRMVPRAGLFAAAKAALEQLTVYLAGELARDGIVVNCIRPGIVETEVVELRQDFAAELDAERSRSPWGDRVTRPQDVGNVVALLCLDEADWICAETIDVDGGLDWWR